MGTDSWEASRVTARAAGSSWQFDSAVRPCWVARGVVPPPGLRTEAAARVARGFPVGNGPGAVILVFGSAMPERPRVRRLRSSTSAAGALSSEVVSSEVVSSEVVSSEVVSSEGRPSVALPSGAVPPEALLREALPSRAPTSGMRSFAVAGLFAGVGGIELGLHRAGHESRLLCELEPGASAVLEHHFPSVRRHADVRTLAALPRGIDLLAAGFPCQDLSQAGQTKGIAGARSGLVREVFRLLEARPVPWLLLENVPFMLQLARGEALNVIISELERLGYRWAYRVINSRAFGLPQRRLRVYLVAALKADPRGVLFADEGAPPEPPAPPIACGFYWTEGIRGLGWAEDGVPTLKGGSTIGIPSPPAIVLPGGRIVKPDIRDAERLQGFDADWTLPASHVVKRGHRWKLVGNAVTVDVAHWLGERLRAPGEVIAPRGQPLRPGRAWPRAAWNIGEGRYEVHASEWPCARRGQTLQDFLQYEPELLSAKATAGFLERTERSSLRFPEGFIDNVRSHLAWMRRPRPIGPSVMPSPRGSPRS